MEEKKTQEEIQKGWEELIKKMPNDKLKQEAIEDYALVRKLFELPQKHTAGAGLCPHAF